MLRQRKKWYYIINNSVNYLYIKEIFQYYKDNLYYLFSQSYSKSKSCIKLLDPNFEFLGQYISSFIGIEGIELDKSGNIIGIFEKNISHSVLFNISMLRGGLKSSLEKKYYIYGDIHQKKLDNLRKMTL